MNNHERSSAGDGKDRPPPGCPIDGRYGLRCGRVHESRMDAWIAHDHAKGVVVHRSGKCEPWRIDGATVAKGAPFHIKSDWSADRKARVLRERMG